MGLAIWVASIGFSQRAAAVALSFKHHRERPKLRLKHTPLK